VYVADTLNCTIRKITSAGVVTTLAGTPGTIGSKDGTGAAAQFQYPTGVAVDGSGNVYVADIYNQTIRKVTSAGVVTTLAGALGLPGYADGTGTAAEFNYPYDVAVDTSGNLYVADLENLTIRKITPANVVTTLAGSPGQGNANGTGSAAQFWYPAGMAADASGNLYVADEFNQMIRKITPAGAVTTFAGTAGDIGFNDGTGGAAQFYDPFGVCVDQSGNVYVADSQAHTVRKITPGGVVTTLAGTPGHSGLTNGTGSGASFNIPIGIAVDNNGNVYVSEQGNFDIRKITAGGLVTTFAGTPGAGGSVDGTGAAAQFNLPAGLAVDGNGNVYVADYGNATIRKITAAGVVTTVAGKAGNQGSADGTGAAAQFDAPIGVALDGSGNLFITDEKNNTIRLMTPSGVVTTLAGKPPASFSSGPQGGYADGTGAAALFYQPVGVVVDGSGNLYVADASNNLIRKGTLNGSPQITAQPTDQYTAVGGSATFSVTASGSGTLTYQWNFGGSAISGATGSSYTVTNAQASNSGAYTVTVTNSNGSVTSSAGNLYVNTGSSGARLINIATRALVGTGGNILIPGFVIGGSGTETLLIRADGPSLTAFGVSGALAAPSLTLTSQATGATLATNTGWGTNSNPAQIASVAVQVGAFALASGSADCAVIVTLQPGAYTVQVSGVGNTTGVALAEVYEVAYTGTARLVNIATRATVGTGGNILIPGFVIGGTGVEELLVRGDGPALTAFGVSGALAQPSLTVTSQATGATIGSNTGWGTNSNPSQISSIAVSVGAFAFATGSADSALIVNLQPGAYTMQISGVGGTTGVGLAEVYEVP
jgi:sugar lactone lactonase YvrE